MPAVVPERSEIPNGACGRGGRTDGGGAARVGGRSTRRSGGSR
ncbi:hypothetical protein ATKI12_3279 [Kitasatospora sp. Ki12]